LYRFFPEQEPISTLDNDIEKALKTAICLTRLRDMDLIVGFENGMPLEFMPTGFYLTASREHQAPVFISAKKKETPLMLEDGYHYLIRVLERYAKHQKLNQSQMVSEMANDPRWICIHHRKALKKQLRKTEKSTIHASTP
jgi:predicted nucleic acid-binding Zn ribbon protein